MISNLTSALSVVLLGTSGNDPLSLGGREPLTSREPFTSREPLVLLRNHGPGTTGGGSMTIPGETLKKGRSAVSLRTDYTSYESISRAEAEAKAIQQGEFDALDSALVETLSLAYGVTDDLELGVQLGYYSGSGFIDAEEDGLGGADSATADPNGPTDLWLTGKFRVLHGPGGQLALLAGVKLPIGEDDEELSNGERLEPSSQPGTGAYDGQAGIAYSRYLTPRMTLDASGVYTLRGVHEGFRVGDRAEVGMALAYRLVEDVRAPNNWGVFGEVQGIWLGRDEADGVEQDASGGTTLYLSAGVRDRVDEHFSFSIAPGVPVVQNTNEDQVEADWRMAVTLTWTP